MNINYDIASKMGYFGGILVIILTGLVLLFIGVIRGYLIMTDFQILSIPLSLGIALFSIGIAMHSCKISEEAKKIATESDKKMSSIANSNFLHAVGKFEDARLDFQRGLYPRRYTLWKSYTYTIEGKELTKFCKIDKDYQNRFISLFENLINIYPWNSSDKIWTEEINHFLFIYDFMMELEVDKTRKDETTNLLVEKMNILLEKKTNEINFEYITRLNEEVKKRNTKEKYRKPFVTC